MGAQQINAGLHYLRDVEMSVPIQLWLIAGITGAVAVIPAGLLLKVIGAPATLVYGALLFAGAFVAATRLSPDVVASDGVGEYLHAPIDGGFAELAVVPQDGYLFASTVARNVTLGRPVEPDKLAFTVTKPMYERLCELDETSFLGKRFWRVLKKARSSG